MSLKQPKVSLQDPTYRYRSIGIGTRVLNKHKCPYRTLGTDTQESVPVPQPRNSSSQIEYQYSREYRYPLHQKGSNGWKMSPTVPNYSQRSPTTRYTIETIKQASKHQEKTNASLKNNILMKIIWVSELNFANKSPLRGLQVCFSISLCKEGSFKLWVEIFEGL
ncbi:hypothetical protein GQ457_07G013930 [Hibiscus cannabinus]